MSKQILTDSISKDDVTALRQCEALSIAINPDSGKATVCAYKTLQIKGDQSAWGASEDVCVKREFECNGTVHVFNAKLESTGANFDVHVSGHVATAMRNVREGDDVTFIAASEYSNCEGVLVDTISLRVLRPVKRETKEGKPGAPIEYSYLIDIVQWNKGSDKSLRAIQLRNKKGASKK